MCEDVYFNIDCSRRTLKEKVCPAVGGQGNYDALMKH